MSVNMSVYLIKTTCLDFFTLLCLWKKKLLKEDMTSLARVLATYAACHHHDRIIEHT